MNISLLVDWLRHSELANFWFKQHALKTGDQLQARVLDVRPDGKILVDFGSFRALAEVKFPVKAGDLIPLQVGHRGERLELEVRSPEKSVLDAAGRPLVMEIRTGPATYRFLNLAMELLQAEGNLPERISQALQKAAEILQPLDPGRSPARISSQLKTLVQDSGLFLEQKLAPRADAPAMETMGPEQAAGREVMGRLAGDLKFELGLIKEYLNQERETGQAVKTRAGRELAALIDDLLGKVSGRQQETAGREQPAQVLAFVLPVREQQGEMALKVYLPRKGGKKSEAVFRVSLLLDLQRLDLLRIDLQQVQSDLLVTFYARRPDITRFLQDHLEEIRLLLQPGFNTVSLRALTDTGKVESYACEDLLTPEKKLVDLSI